MFTPTRAAGLEALADFVPRAGRDYARDRNHDAGPARENVSGLSPYLRHRILTEREVIAAVLEQHSLAGCEKFVQEVFWRTYWKGWLEQRPEVWQRYRRDLAELELSGNSHSHDVAEASAGRTGIDAMDSWVRELVNTGYLHNHARMWFASIWIFTLGLPWQLGADFFYRHLLDGDAASNTLSWRWVAGLQTPGKTYLATASNIARFTEGRFSPAGLATSARALVEDPLPSSERIPPSDSETIGGRVGVLLHEEDLDAASLYNEHPYNEHPYNGHPYNGHPSLDRRRLVSVAGFADPDARSPRGSSERVRRFTESALDDSVTLASSALESPGLVLPDALPSTVLEWAAAAGLDAIVTPYAPVGPVQERMRTLRAALASEAVEFRTVRRRWDDLTWPHAVRGFFPFRERIPALLRQQGL